MPLPQKIQEEREALAKRVVEDIRSGKPFSGTAAIMAILTATL